MLVTVHQPEFMPWAAFFEKMLRSDHFVVLDSVKYQKNYFLNRCRIKQQEEAKWLTVPVQKTASDESIAARQLADNGVWGRKIFNALYFNYCRAPYWSALEGFFEETFLHGEWTRLVDLNLAILSRLANDLSISFQYTRSCDMELHTTGSDLVLEICQKAGASHYLSGAHGREYLDEDAFRQAGIEVVYQDYEALPYEQFNGPYCGPLSIVDAMLNLGPGARAYIESGRRA